MHLTTLAGESSVGALADRLYANLTPDSRKRAEAALIRANPELGRRGGLTTGAVVSVPDVPGLTVKAAPAGSHPVRDVGNGLGVAVADYQKRLAQSIDTAKNDVTDQNALLKTREVKAAIARSPDVAKLLTSLSASLAGRTKALTEIEKRVATVLAQVVKDIDAMGG